MSKYYIIYEYYDEHNLLQGWVLEFEEFNSKEEALRTIRKYKKCKNYSFIIGPLKKV